MTIRNSLIRNKLVLRNHFLWPICHLLHKDKERLASRNNFRVTKKFLIVKFDCSTVHIQCYQMILALYNIWKFVISCGEKSISKAFSDSFRNIFAVPNSIRQIPNKLQLSILFSFSRFQQGFKFWYGLLEAHFLNTPICWDR